MSCPLAPAEAAQEGTESGGRLDHAAQHPTGAAGTQRIGVVDAVATSQRRRDQGQELVSRIRPTWRISQVNVVIHQFPQSQMMGQSGRKEQPSIVDQAVVEGDLDAVGVLKW